MTDRITASGLPGAALCPAFRWNNDPRKDTKDSDRGTAVHEAIEVEDPLGRPITDIPPYDYGYLLLCKIRKEHPDWEERTECKFLCRPLGNAKLDKFFLSPDGTQAIILDWKTGRTRHHAETDLQGKTYVVAVLRHRSMRKVKEVRVMFADLDIEATTEYVFTREDYKAVQAEILAIYYTAMQPNPPRKLCKRCNKCKHALLCPERMAPVGTIAPVMLEPISIPPVEIVEDWSAKDRKAFVKKTYDAIRIEDWTPDQRKEFLLRVKVVTDVLGQFNDAIRDLGRAGEVEVSGFEVVDQQGSIVISDPVGALNALRRYLPEHILHACTKLSVTPLKNAFREFGVEKARELLGRHVPGTVKGSDEALMEILDKAGVLGQGADKKVFRKAKKK